RTDIAVENKALSSQNVVLYRAGDCYLQNDDKGFGAVDAATGAVACVGATTGSGGSHTPNSRIEQWLPITSGSRYIQSQFQSVWSAVLSRTPFPNTCQCTTYQDNGAGLSWSMTLSPLLSATKSHLLTFSPAPTNPVVTTKTADASQVSPSGVAGYTIRFDNPNNVGVTLSTLTDDLPAGFTYAPGSATGATTANPVVTNGGRHLEWAGPITIAANGNSQLHFRATAAATPGDYFNRAGGTATGNVTVTPTGDTALVRVLGPAALNITADRSSVAAGPSDVPTGDIPLQPMSPAAQAAPLLKLDLLGSPLLKLDLLGSPLLKLDLLGSPLLKLDLLGSPLLKLDLLGSPLGFEPLGNSNDLGGSPLVKAGLAQIPLSTLPVIHGDDWPTRLAGTGLTGPLETITFGDVLASNISETNMPSLSDLDLTVGPLGRLTSLSLYMGDTRLTGIAGVDWCAELERLGHADCGAALGVPGNSAKGRSASLLSLEISGVALDNIAGLKTVHLSDVTFPADRAVLPLVLLRSINLATSDFGGLLVRNAQNVVDCTKIACGPTSTKNLYDAQQAGALLSDATIGSLGAAAGSIPLVEAALGLAANNSGEDAFNLSPADLGVLGYGGSSPQDVHYTVTFSTPTVLDHPVFTVTLPSEFRYVPGSSAATLNGASLTGAPAPQATGESVVWDFGTTSIPAGQPLVITFAARPGLVIGSVNATVAAAGTGFILNAATPSPLIVVENFETGDNGSSSAIQPGRLYFGHISHSGDIDNYTFTVPSVPGSTVRVALTQGDSDSDVVLYHPASSLPNNALRPPAALPAIQTSLDRPMTLGNQGEPLDPRALDDIPIANLPVAGVSANRGLNSDSVEALSWEAPAGAQYTVQISGYNGAIGVAAYGFRVTVTPPPITLPAGSARVFPHDADATIDTPAVPSSWAGTTALLIADRARLRRAFGNARADIALNALSRLEGAGIGARTLFVDAFPEVNAAFAALDARPSSAELSNNVVRAINNRVDQTLGAARDGLQYMVLVGTDEILPMSRVPDLTATANERSFAQELLDLASATGGNNALLGAAASGLILSDDAYGSFRPMPFLGTFLYTPDVSLGRLVESPEDINAVVNQFMTPVQSGDGPGVLRPAKSLVTGYDFMTSLANEVKTALNNDVTPGQVTSLINETWTRTDLENAFTRAPAIPDIISANAHYAPDALLPANGGAGLFTTDAFGGSTPPDIARRILFQMGCHSGFSISNFLSSTGTAADWPEAMLGRGTAAFVGNTGFGIGLRSTVAFSARITADFAHNLSRMPLGTALAQAKRDYLGGGSPNVYDYKVMAEATYFGLPMFHLPGATSGPTPAPPRATTTDAATGLTAVDIVTSQPVSSSAWEAVNNGEGNYWQLAPARLLAVAPNRPIEPKVVFDVTQPGLEARGAVLTRLQSVAQNGYDPALARPVVGEAANETELQTGEVLFPTSQQAVTHTPGRDQVALVLGHFQSTNTSGNVTGVQTRFTKMDARVLFSPPSNPDHKPPVFQSTNVVKNGSTASFRVVATDPDGGTVRDVNVLFTDGSSPDWTFRHLARSGDGSFVGGFPVSGNSIQFIAQAIDAAGMVALTTNKGDFFNFTDLTNVPNVEVEVAGTGANGWYQDGSTVTLSGPEGSTFNVSDNGGPVSTWSTDQPIPVSGSGVHTLHWQLVGTGAVGDVTVPVDTALPVITGAPTSSPNAAGWYRGPVTVHFDCADAESGVATCEPDRTVSTDGTGQSVTGRATDNVGNANTTTVGGINIDTTAPTIGGAPTTAANAAGWYRGPVTVHFTCSDERSGVAQCPADQTISTQGTNQSVSGTAVDAAGNSTSFTVTGINIDSTPPVLTGTPDHAANANGWYRDSVIVNFSCADGSGSGVA
ncbi:MAG: large repetitive protein, partial [Actinomycetota bacterium]